MQGFGAYAADTSGAERDNFDYVVASGKGDTLEMERITQTTVAGAVAMRAAQAAADAAAAQAAADAAAKRIGQVNAAGGTVTSSDYAALVKAADDKAKAAAVARASAATEAAKITAIEAAQAQVQQAAYAAQEAAAAQLGAGNALTTTVNPETDFTAAGGAAAGSPPNLMGWLSANPSALWIGGAAVLGLVLLLRRR